MHANQVIFSIFTQLRVLHTCFNGLFSSIYYDCGFHMHVNQFFSTFTMTVTFTCMSTRLFFLTFTATTTFTCILTRLFFNIYYDCGFHMHVYQGFFFNIYYDCHCHMHVNQAIFSTFTTTTTFTCFNQAILCRLRSMVDT